MGKSLMQCDIELHFGANGDTEWSFPKHTFPINHSSRGGCVWARWKRVTSGKGGKHEEGDAEKEREKYAQRGQSDALVTTSKSIKTNKFFHIHTHVVSVCVCGLCGCKQWNRYHFSQSGKMVSALTLPNLTGFLHPGKLRPQGRRVVEVVFLLLKRTFGQLRSHKHALTHTRKLDRHTHTCLRVSNKLKTQTNFIL